MVSSHRILPGHNTCRDHIDEVDHIDAEDGEGGCDFSPADDRECRDEECEHDRPRVTHDHASRYICSCEEVGDRDDDREEREEESTIFLACECLIGEYELDREDTKYDKRYQCKSTRESRNSVRKIHRVKNKYIPKYRHQNRDIPYLIPEEDRVVVIQVDDISEQP